MHRSLIFFLVMLYDDFVQVLFEESEDKIEIRSRILIVEICTDIVSHPISSQSVVFQFKFIVNCSCKH